jgi:hypothetical protein
MEEIPNLKIKKEMSEQAWIESIIAIVLDKVPVRALCLIVTEYSREFLVVLVDSRGVHQTWNHSNSLLRRTC